LKKHDVVDCNNRLIRIKITQGKHLGISSEPICLIVLCLDRITGKAAEIYNGPGNLVWNECGKMQKIEQSPIFVSKLK
jgi:hypothetical protein